MDTEFNPTAYLDELRSSLNNGEFREKNTEREVVEEIFRCDEKIKEHCIKRKGSRHRGEYALYDGWVSFWETKRYLLRQEMVKRWGYEIKRSA